MQCASPTSEQERELAARYPGWEIATTVHGVRAGAATQWRARPAGTTGAWLTSFSAEGLSEQIARAEIASGK